jgi:predicted DNA-binding helix-hairpin-helix protein
MDASQKFKLFATQMDLEPAEDTDARPIALNVLPQKPVDESILPCGQVSSRANVQAKRESLGITQAIMPGGKTIALLKTMMTSACERNCFYCPFRAGRNYRRATFKPEEMAGAFMDMYRASMVEGMFLSSGIIRGGIASQDKIIDAADILRNKLGFRGYVHLKIMPGSERDQVRRTMELASRVSVNLEGPNDKRLQMLAPKKMFLEELLQPLKWVEEIRREEQPLRSWNGRWPYGLQACT